MANNKIIQMMRDKEMDRKDFLKYSGLVLISVVGLKTVANLLLQSDSKKKLQQEATRGFGSGKYGA